MVSFAGSVQPCVETDAVVHEGEEGVDTLVLVYEGVEDVLVILSLFLLLSFHS